MQYCNSVIFASFAFTVRRSISRLGRESAQNHFRVRDVCDLPLNIALNFTIVVGKGLTNCLLRRLIHANIVLLKYSHDLFL